MASSPCSGRTLARGSSHFGPPTAPSSTASAARATSSVSGGSADPVASMAAPPMRASRSVKVCPHFSSTTASTRLASPTTSGPIPSPGKTAMAARIFKTPSGCGRGGPYKLQSRESNSETRDRVAAAGAEGLARDLETWGHLAAFVFALLDTPDDIPRHRGVEALGDQRAQIEPPRHMGFRDCVEKIIGGQDVLVGLVGTQ